MPLAINLLAHLVDSEGCSKVLSQWKEGKTSLLSEGHDRRSNLDLSISLSLASPRLKSLPLSKDLLGLLSVLQVGLSDSELLQSNVPIDNILGCIAALVQTALVYRDEQRLIKALVPIREYMKKSCPPEDHYVRPLLKHSHELLMLHAEYRGTESASGTVSRISSNFSNIQNVLLNGLQQGHSDLNARIYCACDLNTFSQLVGRGNIPLIDVISNMFFQLSDYRLQVYFITELVRSGATYRRISDHETMMISHALEHLGQFDDSNLKCRFYIAGAHYYSLQLDKMNAAIKFCESAYSLGIATRNTKKQSDALEQLAFIKWVCGDSSAPQIHAQEAQQLARISGDLHREAQALRVEALCLCSLGHYRPGISILTRARDLLCLCGLSHGKLDHAIMTSQIVLHDWKSEYVEARNIYTQMLQEASVNLDSYNHCIVLMSAAELDISMNAPASIVQKNIDKVKSMLKNVEDHRLGMGCEFFQAHLTLRDGDMISTKKLFCDGLKSALGKYSEHVIASLDVLADAAHWNNSHDVLLWTTMLLVHSLKSNQKLAMYKALQFFG